MIESVSFSVILRASGHSLCTVLCFWQVENLPQSGLTGLPQNLAATSNWITANFMFSKRRNFNSILEADVQSCTL